MTSGIFINEQSDRYMLHFIPDKKFINRNDKEDEGIVVVINKPVTLERIKNALASLVLVVEQLK